MVSAADASNVAIITKETAKQIGQKLYGKIDTTAVRERIFNNSYLLLLVVVDEQYEQVTMYHRGLEIRMMPGTTLIREWDRREYRVTVLPDGYYELNGQRYKSLSAAARAITGTHWSGPAFFGIKGARK